MTLEQRKTALIELGQRLQNIDEATFERISQAAVNQNNWFTAENIKTALKAWSESLTEEKVNTWIKDHQLSPNEKLNIGLVMAGNIPMVGLHDLLSVVISGHMALVKVSSQDTALINFIIQHLVQIEPELNETIQLVEQLNNADAVIATGSDNTARYFKHYFGKKPHIIRQNRTSIGVIRGDESDNDFKRLGKDIFTYYGLGCRNVSKLYIPQGFDLTKLIDGLMSFESVIDHHKFRNNYDYNKSIYLVNNEPHLDSGFFLMRETEDLVSPISVIFYQYYDSEAQLSLNLSTIADKTQCMVSKEAWYPHSLDFGEAQSPELWDYADGVNTLEFLGTL